MNLIDREISIRKSLQRAGGELALTATKTQRSTRRLALPEECVTALRARRAQQNADRLAAGEKWTASDLVFTTRNGTPIEPPEPQPGVRDPEQAGGHPASPVPRPPAHLRIAASRAGGRRPDDHGSPRTQLIRVTMDIYTFVRLARAGA